MTDSPQNLLEFAGMITAVGMGVVFTALLFLSIYMRVFKKFINKFEDGKNKSRAPASKVPTSSAPVVEKAKPGNTEDEQVAAAVAVSLYLDGVMGGPDEATAAAIATAIALEQNLRTVSITTAPGQNKLGWSAAGRLDAQTQRFGVQSRAAGPRSAA